jgi:hypothetical protein
MLSKNHNKIVITIIIPFFNIIKFRNIFLKKIKKIYDSNFQYILVDSDQNKQGQIINGIQIAKPEILKTNNDKIFISSAQSYDDIYEKLINDLNISNDRIIHGIFI